MTSSSARRKQLTSICSIMLLLVACTRAGTLYPKASWSALWKDIGAPLVQLIQPDEETNDTYTNTLEPNCSLAAEDTGARYHVAKFDFGYVKTHLLVALWVLFASVAKIFFHSQKKLSTIFPESCLLIVIGVALGVILYFAKAGDYQLNVHVFFLILLPPIILDAGYYMPARSFFDNLGTILWYAVIGTLVNTLLIGFALWGVSEAGGFASIKECLPLLHCLVFASLLAAVDPVAVLAVFESIQVNEVLYIIVFGESLLNDGISVVLYHMFEGFAEIGQAHVLGIDIIAGLGSFVVIVLGSPAIGILLGFFCGFLTRFTKHIRLMEPLLILIIGYISFLVAEMFHLSGILSCTFCGITMRKYVEARISQKSMITIRYVLKTLASVTETIIFMYLGIAAVNTSHHWDTAFVVLTVVFCLIFRSIGCISLTFLANIFRQQQLTAIDQFIMAYGGLRGAIAFALVVLLDEDLIKNKNLFVTTTVVVIYFTNLIMGTTVRPVVNVLRVKKKDTSKPTMNEKIAQRFTDHTMAGIEAIMDQHGYNRIRQGFSKWNNSFLKPLIIGEHPSQMKGYELFNMHRQLSEKDARRMSRVPSVATEVHKMQTQMRRMSSTGQMNPSQSDANLFERGMWSLPSFSMERRDSSMNSIAGDYRRDSVDPLILSTLSASDLSLGLTQPRPSIDDRSRLSIDGNSDSGLRSRRIVSFIRDPETGSNAEIERHWQAADSTRPATISQSAIHFTAASSRHDEPIGYANLAYSSSDPHNTNISSSLPADGRKTSDEAIGPPSSTDSGHVSERGSPQLQDVKQSVKSSSVISGAGGGASSVQGGSSSALKHEPKEGKDGNKNSGQEEIEMNSHNDSRGNRSGNCDSETHRF